MAYDPEKDRLLRREQLAAVETPGAYAGANDDALRAAAAAYTDRQKFNYNVNADALYKQYRDQYMKAGRTAAQDTMGQAAAMTGGYGNSYAAAAGNQAYQQYLGRLNEAVPQLYNLALQRYQMEDEQAAKRYSMLAAEDQRQYGRWSDDYNRWAQALEARESADQWDRNFGEGVRQYDRNFAEDVRQYNQNFAENQRQFDASLAEQAREFDYSYGEKARQFDANYGYNYDKLISSVDPTYTVSKPGGSGSSGGSSGGSAGSASGSGSSGSSSSGSGSSGSGSGKGETGKFMESALSAASKAASNAAVNNVQSTIKDSDSASVIANKINSAYKSGQITWDQAYQLYLANGVTP